MSPPTRMAEAATRETARQSPHLIEADAARALAQGIVDTIRAPLVVLDRSLRVIAASRAFCATFGLDIDDILGEQLYELGGGEWNIPDLRLLMERIIPEHGAMENYEVEHDFRLLGRRTMLLNAREVFYAGGSPANIFLSIEDVTAKRLLERQIAESFLLKDTMLDEIYHRMANSLQIIASIVSIKARKVTSDEARRHLEDTRDRIISVAAVQKHLHASTGGGAVALLPYLSKLCEAISCSLISSDRPISIEIRGEGGEADRPKAEIFGLIVAELVVNSLKHAFGDVSKDGLITVTCNAIEAEWMLSVSDNGKGKQQRAGAQEGLGTGIVAALASQLNARVVTESGPEGTSVSIAHSAVPID